MKTIKLGDIAQIDISNVDKKIKEGDSDIILCNFVDVYHSWAITSSLVPKLMKSTANDNQIRRFSLHKGQVAITKDSENRNDIGISAYIADELPNVLLGYHCALITPDESVLMGKFLNIIMHSPYAQKYFEMNSSGSGQRYTLTNEIIARFPIPIPDLEKQKTIGDFFSAVDMKIHNNISIGAELEAMIKSIYDYWFLQFDFPDENGRPYRSFGGRMVWNEELKREIPEGWEVKSLKDIEANIVTGKTPSTKDESNYNGDIPFIKIGDIRGNMHIVKTEQTISKRGADSQNSKYIPSGSICVTCIASPGLVAFSTKKSQTNQQINSIVCDKDYNRLYLYFSIIDYFKYSSGAKTGNSFANMNKEDFSRIKLIYPSIEILEKYDKKTKDIFEKILIESKENQELISLRDFLLPLLINGQVSFK